MSCIKDKTSKIIADIANSVILELTKSGMILFFNQKANCVFSNIVTAKKISDILSLDDAEVLLKNMEIAFYHNHPHHFYWKFQQRFYLVYVYPKDKSVWVVLDDISEKRQLAHLLQVNSQRIKFVEKISKTGYWELDLIKKQFYWSDEMYKLFGIDKDKGSYHSNLIRKLIHKDDLYIYKQKIKELVNQKNDIQGQVRIVSKNNILKYCRFMAGIIYENGEEKIAGVFQDVSELIKIQAELTTAKVKAEEANLAKTYFLAQAGHDIRQPLQAINLFAEGLKTAPISKYAEIADKILLLSKNLSTMLNNLLDFAKFDSGETMFDPQYFDLAELLRKIADEYKQTTEKNIIFRLKTTIVYQDAFLLERIVRNLLSNAVKYAKTKIVIGNDENCFWVIDDGIGINECAKKHIFDAFYQCNEKDDRKKGGIGIGLNIVKKTALAIGAKIFVRSGVDKYTIFKICL